MCSSRSQIDRGDQAAAPMLNLRNSRTFSPSLKTPQFAVSAPSNALRVDERPLDFFRHKYKAPVRQSQYGCWNCYSIMFPNTLSSWRDLHGRSTNVFRNYPHTFFSRVWNSLLARIALLNRQVCGDNPHPDRYPQHGLSSHTAFEVFHSCHIGGFHDGKTLLSDGSCSFVICGMLPRPWHQSPLRALPLLFAVLMRIAGLGAAFVSIRRPIGRYLRSRRGCNLKAARLKWASEPPLDCWTHEINSHGNSFFILALRGRPLREDLLYGREFVPISRGKSFSIRAS